MNRSGFVVSRPYPDSNVGSNLSSLAGAAWVAERLGRTLIVDWRGQRQLRDATLNYFSEFFATPAELGGVTTFYASDATPDYSETTPGTLWISPAQARDYAGRATAPDSEYLIIQPYHGLDRVHPGPERDRFALLREFYRDIQLAPHHSHEPDRWHSRHCGGNVVVGVNVRTGNGAYFGKGMRHASRVDVSVFADPRRFLHKVEAACRQRLKAFPKSLRDAFVIFYATDSRSMSELLAGLPNAVTRRTVFPPAGEGDLYTFPEVGYTDRDSIADTLIDMYLLARCDALVYNSSLFNQYARVSTAWFGGNHVHIETLFPRQRARRFARAARVRIAGKRAGP